MAAHRKHYSNLGFSLAALSAKRFLFEFEESMIKMILCIFNFDATFGTIPVDEEKRELENLLLFLQMIVALTQPILLDVNSVFLTDDSKTLWICNHLTIVFGKF